MEYIGFVFGIFGLMAYLQISELKGSIANLERELTKMKGTSYHEDRTSLLEAAKSYIGKEVSLDMKEDQEDVDILNYGNSKHGKNIILDCDEEWLLLKIESAKGVKTKLIRMESVERISVIKA
ncbi:MAG: hypothetical protein IKE59_05950 [Erysipelotrichaceae bacterium]|nr:hypothetical protein [Erysipelotrichaceae bacterium]